MEHHFLGMETLLDSGSNPDLNPQLNLSIQHHLQAQTQHQNLQQQHLQQYTPNSIVSPSNSQPRSLQQHQHDPNHKLASLDFDLSNSNSIVTGRTMLQDDPKLHQHQQIQNMDLHNTYHLQQVPSTSSQLHTELPLQLLYGPTIIQQQIQQQPHNNTHQHQYHLDVRLDDMGSSGDSNSNSSYSDKKLVSPIPPLHMQQQIVNGTSDPPIRDKSESLVTSISSELHNAEGDQILRASCSRCKKEFDQPIILPQSADSTKLLVQPKIFKLCQHCRDLQRKRSRKWQKKTKDKEGICRRCGSEIPTDEQMYVLCSMCRLNLRTRKASRAAQGKCVHCSGPLDASIIVGDDIKQPAKKDAKAGNYKVCQRCRENDKIRRTNLEKMGNCNRCAKALPPADVGKHKVCVNCRNRKKRMSKSSPNTSIDSLNTNGNNHDSTNSMMNNISHNGNAISQQLAIMPNDQHAAMAILSGAAEAQYPQLPMNQNFNAQQFAQAQYNQAIIQQQAFNQVFTQAHQQQNQPQQVMSTQLKQYDPSKGTVYEFQGA